MRVTGNFRYAIVVVIILTGVLELPTGCDKWQEKSVRLGAGGHFRNTGADFQMVVLPDSNRLMVLPGSEVRLSDGYEKTDRNLDLDGVAVFLVGRETGTAEIPVAGGPFIVRSRNLQIEVLSRSSFYVEAYRKDAGEEVLLLKGSLRVAKNYRSPTDNELEILRDSEMVMINRDIDLMEKEKMDSGDLAKIKGPLRGQMK
jgi:hypothetical protein